MKKTLLPDEKKSLLRKRLFTAAAVLFWLAVWQASAMLVGKSVLLASPVEALERLIALIPDKRFYESILSTSGKILLGFFLGNISGIVLAVAAGKLVFVERLLSPLIMAVKSVPVASFTILALIWISSSELSVLITFLIALPVSYSNIFEGISSLDGRLTVMADIFEIPAGRRFIGIYLSQMMPYFRSSVKLSMGLCWKSGVAAEVIGIPKGSIGEKLYNSKVYLETADLFAWTLVIILLSLVCERLFLLIVDIARKRIERS